MNNSATVSSSLQNGNYLVAGLAVEIVVKDHYWICTDTGSAANAIDFLVRVRKTSFNDAMRLLSSVQPAVS